MTLTLLRYTAAFEAERLVLSQAHDSEISELKEDHENELSAARYALACPVGQVYEVSLCSFFRIRIVVPAFHSLTVAFGRVDTSTINQSSDLNCTSVYQYTRIINKRCHLRYVP